MSSLGLTVARVEKQVIVTAPGTQGPPGIQGEVGDTGETGPIGPQGNSISIKGTLAAGAWSAPASPTIGDIWIAGGVITGAITAVLGDGIQWTGTLWVNVGQIRGPIGLTGNSCIIRGTLSAGAWSAPGSPVAGDAWIAGGVITGAITAVLGDGIVFNGTTWNNVGQLRGPVGPSGSVNGTVGKIPKFITTTAVADSSTLSESGTTVTASGALVVTGNLDATQGSVMSTARTSAGSKGGIQFTSEATSNAYVALGLQSLGSESFTVGFTAKLPSTSPSSSQYFFGFYNDTSNRMGMYVGTSGQIALICIKAGVNTTTTVLSGAVDAMPGQTITGTVTRSGTTLSVLLNGVSVVATTNASLDITFTPSTQFTVGALSAGNTGNSAGPLYGCQLFNRALSVSEQASYAINGIDPSDEFGSMVVRTSGQLTIGKRYRIVLFNSGDSFTSVGASSNTSGVEFVATGKTPTWSNSSQVIALGVICFPNLAVGLGATLYDQSPNGLDMTAGGTYTHLIPIRAAPLGNPPVYIQLPTNSLNIIPALEGRELNVYFRNVIWTSVPLDQLSVVVTCTKGAQFDKFWRYTPTSGDAGTTTFTITVYSKDGTTQLATASSTLKTVALSNPSTPVTRKLLMIGDSTMAGGIVAAELVNLFDGDTKYTLTEVGSNSGNVNDSASVYRAVKTEAISGWAFNTFTTDTTTAWTQLTGAARTGSPFCFSGAFNFASYLSAQSITMSSSDWVIINLGINDVFYYTTDTDVNTKIGNMLAQLSAWIASIKAAVSGVRIGICMTIPPVVSQDGFGYVYGTAQTRQRYIRNQKLWRDAVIANYDTVTVANVFVIPYHINLDTENNFELASVSVNARNSSTYSQTQNGVHPDRPGYYQLADTLRSFLKNKE